VRSDKEEPRSFSALVLGTTNNGKLVELVELLEPFGITCCSLAGNRQAVFVDETGSSFAENAALKAAQQARALHRWVLAEDSGLVVDALDGAPGIYSARFSSEAPAVGDLATCLDDRNNALLLERLAAITGGNRSAHYACHAALADPAGMIVATSQGLCGGVIAESAQGSSGFGYDPLFVVPEYHRTFGQLSPAVKALISHRGRAMRQMIPFLLKHLANPLANRIALGGG